MYIHRNVHLHIGLAVAAWFLLALAGSLSGVLSQPGIPVRLGIFLLVPAIGFLTWYGWSAAFRAAVRSWKLEWITAAHLWRFVGLAFLAAYVLGRLPAGFALPAGIGDVMVAATALPLARALHRKEGVRSAFLTWNIFGLADLIIAVSLGVLFSNNALLADGVTSGTMALFPGSLIPSFFVPSYSLLHLLALSRRDELTPGVTTFAATA